MTIKQDDNIDSQIETIESVDNLNQLNEILTKLMAQQKIQAFIKDENLSRISGAVINLSLTSPDPHKVNALYAAAILGRLAAVARGREDQVFEKLSDIFHEKPIQIEKLSDGDEKYYAAVALSYTNEPWLIDYCLQQSVETDTAEKARKVFLIVALKNIGNLNDFWIRSSPYFEHLNNIENRDARLKRVRRIAATYFDVIHTWQNEVGSDPGASLADWAVRLLSGNVKDADIQVLTDILDDIFSILLRIVQLRFSFALLPETYNVLDKLRLILGREVWNAVLRKSIRLEEVRICLKESALVLARQNRTDKELMGMLGAVYQSRNLVVHALTAHFTSADDIDPDVKEWWIQGGLITESKRVIEHSIGNSEDQQIGSLLINVEESQAVMEKLERAVVPFLELSDPPLASSVKKATASYNDIALIARKLATMRKLSNSQLKGSIQEYNPLEHEMLGGNRLGVRKVKILRDGIQKSFGGKIKTLVKPWVEPAD